MDQILYLHWTYISAQRDPAMLVFLVVLVSLVSFSSVVLVVIMGHLLCAHSVYLHG